MSSAVDVDFLDTVHRKKFEGVLDEGGVGEPEETLSSQHAQAAREVSRGLTLGFSMVNGRYLSWNESASTCKLS